MILLSLGTLGDFIIQASLLRDLDRPETRVAVPESLAAAARTLFPRAAEIIAMPEKEASAKYIGHSAEGLAKPMAYLSERYPGVPVASLAMNSVAVGRRDSSLYDVYRELYLAHPLLKEHVYPQSWDRAGEWAPFKPRWSRAKAERRLLIWPIGGIAVKNLSPELVKAMAEQAHASSFETTVAITELDDSKPYEAALPGQVVRVGLGRALEDAAELIRRSLVTVSVDTAWYHWAALLGSPTLGIPGPRSPEHFILPLPSGLPLLDTHLACVNCYSGPECVVSGKTICQAKPLDPEILAALAAYLQHAITGSETAIRPGGLGAHADTRVRKPAWLKGAASRAYLSALDEIRGKVLVPALASPIRPWLRSCYQGLKSGLRPR